MAREFFKNLPNTTTPLNAQRMNSFLNGEEAMGSIVVDDVIGKNLFDKNNYNLVNIWMGSSGFSTNTSAKTIYISIKPNTTYTVTKHYWNTADFYIATCPEIPVDGGTYTDRKGVTITDTTNNHLTITSGANDNYLVVYANWTSTNLTEVLNNLQIEKGSVSTDYVEHKEFANDLEVILYENSTGSNETITLSKSVANAKKIKLYYRSSDGVNYKDSKEILEPNNARVTLRYDFVYNNVIYTKLSNIVITGNTITQNNAGSYRALTIGTGGTVSSSETNGIYITKVVAYYSNNETSATSTASIEETTE